MWVRLLLRDSVAWSSPDSDKVEVDQARQPTRPSAAIIYSGERPTGKDWNGAREDNESVAGPGMYNGCLADCLPPRVRL